MTSLTKISWLVSWFCFGTLAIALDNDTENCRCKNESNLENKTGYANKKTILLWNTLFESEWFWFGSSGQFDHCPKHNNCYLTRSRTLMNVDKFDAILFHGNDLRRSDVPEKRKPRQSYVFVNLESPKNRPVSDSTFENFFNLTMTYRLDSDIPWPYYVVRNIETGKVLAPLENVDWMDPSYDPKGRFEDSKFGRKNKMAAWLVSNCETYGGREFLVNELRKYLKIDIIGKCNKPVAPECRGSNGSCFDKVIEPNYFFYLSFENTLCQDYVTEKFFNALSHDVIPVVYGGANYSIFAPPHSYIDALDFDSPKALADFMIDLSHNKEEYLKYFWWKKLYTVGSSIPSTVCKLCERINDESQPPKRYSPLSDWYLKNKCPIQKFLNGRNHATKEMRNYVNNV